MTDHHHAHGPANRGRVVHTTSAPLFVTGDERAPAGAVVIVHGEPGIDAGLEAHARSTAAGGCLVVIPYLYFRDGGPDHPRADRAAEAFTRLPLADVDADVDGAVDHLTGRLGFARELIRLAGAGAGLPAAIRAAERLGLRAPRPTDPSRARPTTVPVTPQ